MTDYTDKINSLQNDVIPALKADRDNYIDSIISAAQEEDVGRIRALFGPLSSSVVMVDGITEVMKDLQAETEADNVQPVDPATMDSMQCACAAQNNSAPVVDNTQPVVDPAAPEVVPVADVTPADTQPVADPNVPTADPATPVVQDPNQPSQ